MDIAEAIRNAGIIGAGGAGFPTHVKVSCKADVVIANGAECEPLLQVDQIVMSKFADRIVLGMLEVIKHTGAKEGVFCLKKHYHDAVSAMKEAIKDKSNLSLKLFDSFYPAGDEQEMVYEVIGKVVPTGGLPLDVGAVVLNVSTLMNVADAIEGKPVTDKHVTVGGEVENPVTVNVPIGTPIGKLIEFAGGPLSSSVHSVIIGGPCMGRVSKDWDEPVAKTMGGVLVFRDDHSLLDKKKDDLARDIKLAKAVCCQCSLCTQMCPRNALGLKVEPHRAMRAAANGDGTLLGDVNGIFSCCDCGLCTYYACNFGLAPQMMMTRMKESLGKAGVKPWKEVARRVDRDYDIKKIPVSRLISRLGIRKYDVDSPLTENTIAVDEVIIPLKMHIGVPSEAVVSKGERVEKDSLIADIPNEKLGAKVHASISGTITEIDDKSIRISKAGG